MHVMELQKVLLRVGSRDSAVDGRYWRTAISEGISPFSSLVFFSGEHLASLE